VAKLCSQCGNPLLRKNARFCNNCGASISSSSAEASPASPRTDVISGDQQSIPIVENAGERPVLREQIAFVPPQRPAPVDPPPWMSKLEKMGSRARRGDPLWSPANESQNQAAPPKLEPPPTNAVRSSLSPAGPQLPQREMRIKVWQGAATTDFAAREEQQNGRREEQAESQSAPTTPVNDHRVEDLPTTPMLSAVLPGHNEKPPSPVAPQDRSAGRPFPAQSYRQAVPTQRPVTPPLPTSLPGFQQPATSGRPAGSFQARPARRKSKLRLVVVLVLLLVLLLGGLTTWIIAYQPFSVPAVTKTTLSFQNSDLGIALQYPQGWTAQLDKHNQAVSFFDVNHTDQVNVSVSAINGQNAAQYIKKEASQLGLSAQKNQPPLTFAGATWQQLQGTALLSGATYTETLLVTTHGSNFYAVVEMAPASTYTGADHIFFSIVRASFQFL